MIHAGFVIENPITRSRIHVIESDAETAGKGWLLEVTCVPGAPPDVVEHVHKTWTETFTILSGSAHYSVEGAKKTASAGESYSVQPGQRHVHPWNAGDVPLVYRQRDVFASPSAEAVQDTLGVFATNAVLAREGKVDVRGVAKNPLQLAATLRTLNKHGGYVTEVPAGVQDAVGATLGRLAEAMGYRGVYPQFVNEQK
jgi:mannose-6-phosphate isomerase-like protein (cupin superfamily)